MLTLDLIQKVFRLSLTDIKQQDFGWDSIMEVKFLTEAQNAIEDLKNQTYQLRRIQHILKTAKLNKQTVFVCGNGGSAGTASHFVCDLFKTSKVRSICLNENKSLTTAMINDEGWDNLYLRQLERLFNKGDVLIVISVHGGVGSDNADLWSQNLVKAVEYVNKNGGMTIGLSGFDGGSFVDVCNTNIVIHANSTPLVESLHSLVCHLIAFSIEKE